MPRLLSALKWHPGATLIGFAPEWFGVGLLTAADLVLCLTAGLRFVPGGMLHSVLGFALLGAGMTARKLGAQRAGVLLEYLALMLAGGIGLAVASYAAIALSGPLYDAQFLAIDRAMGFDWQAWLDFVRSHRPLGPLLRFLYVNIGFEALYLTILMAVMNRPQRLKEIFWLFIIAAAITDTIAWAVPAMGPYKIFGMEKVAAFLPDLERLKSGHDLTFALDRLQGVLTFPSFHTVMALGFAYGLRGTGPIGWSVMAINVFLLLGIAPYGGHYAIDVVGGIVVFAVSAAAVRLGGRASCDAAEDSFDGIVPAPQEAN